MKQHPAYHDLAARFAYARQMWRDNPGVQEAAATIGMSEYEYCHSVVAGMGPLFWTGSSSNPSENLTHNHYWQAFLEAA